MSRLTNPLKEKSEQQHRHELRLTAEFLLELAAEPELGNPAALFICGLLDQVFGELPKLCAHLDEAAAAGVRGSQDYLDWINGEFVCEPS